MTQNFVRIGQGLEGLNVKLVHWPLMGGLLHAAMRGLGGATDRPGPPRCTKCNGPPINGQCTNHRIAV